MAKKTKTPQANFSLQGLLNRYFSSMLTPQQMRKQARRETNLAMQDSMRQLRTTYQRERERTLREQYAQGVYAGLLRGAAAPGSADAQAIRDAYAHAAGLSQAEQEGFILPTTAQQQANTEGATTVAQNVAGYTGDVAAITPGAATGAQQAGVNRDVLMYLASLPKGTFAANAEAAAAGLNREGARLAGEFGTREAALGQDLREMQDNYTMAVRDLLAKRPGQMQEALGNLRESGRGDFATMINALYLQNTMGKTEAELTGTYKGKPTQAAKLAAQELKLKKQIENANNWYDKQRLGIQLMNARTAQKRARIAARQANIDAAAKTGDLTKVQQTFRTEAKEWVEGLLNVNKRTGLPRTPISKQALINGIMRTYGQPLFKQFGRQQVLAWAQAVVNAFPPRYWTGKKTGGGPAQTPEDILGG